MSDTLTSDEALLETIRQLAAELHPSRPAAPASLDNRLDQEYGFDSLARVELFLRIEKRFGVSLPETVMASAETPRDLMRAMLAASPARHAYAGAVERVSALAAESETPDQAATLPEVLEWHVERHPNRPHIVLQDEDGAERTITYSELGEAARAIAAGLQERGLQPGHAVAIMLPTSAEYFFSFFGILLAGGIPVPIYPPARASQIEDHLRRHAGILSNALTECLITVPQAKPIALLLRPQVATLKSVVTPEELTKSGRLASPHRATPQEIAMLQYTSGSTGDPKGVILTHANLLINIRAMGRALRVTPTDVFVSWLPLYHDMGLIGAWMGSLIYGFKYPVLSPLTFLSRPERWLRTIHRHGGTLTGGPNFCYDLCLRRIQDADIEGLDLSSWRFAFNGAEPVSPETMAAFSKRFARWGFKPEAMSPVYGLAEATLGVSFTPPGRGPKLDRVDKDQFMRGGRAVPVPADHADALTFVACGLPIPGHQIRIVDGSGRELPERAEGHIQFSGPSVTSGYYRNPEATRNLLHGEWMDTGDYGYIAEGEIYISGRVKDVIIRAGRNIYPYELEEAVGAIEGVRKGCVAVFGSKDARAGTERVVVLAETRVADPGRQEALRARINELAVSLIGMPVDEIVLAQPYTVLKTSSGKIRRAASRDAYERGGHAGTRAVWLQIVRLTWFAILPQARRTLRAAVDRVYGAYALFLLGTMGAMNWTACAVLPRAEWAWKLSHRMARAFLASIGMPPAVRGLEHLPAGPCMMVVNHASYLDGIVVVAALAQPKSFVAKRELLDHWVPRIYLKSVGSAFVDRLDAQRGVEDTARFVDVARGGKSLIVFPEGTLRRMPGLLEFRMGAFVVAAQADVPVVPVTIRGTRSALRDGQWLFHRSRISVTIGVPIAPVGRDWNAAIQLRDAARAEILRLCGEPDLSEETSLPPKKPQQREA
ncbi:MAG: acyl-phosphate glycerol 3-phosphate acyltransferase [Betaproteobacteria bacterium RIFCSPLOWO2_12_FULL_62_58]|nr:MAG: acyl-phosphate glycerol 3-phosphate acyltransferase [Betaproteobacteria bacterium RIFCSPLOWO2_12_FULL_62_58]